ncbi:uncharacterized protein ACA1_071700 [Acanthamoeba castellanii str. Neff]|uniref:Uncharacterized protein n=1 Tax=Acanthamoeba castellanii (strain ATCC 30010 / Neff) TaxID=1257118 RepID=L8HFP3_ACACF|nr:uncharacterized protein ACA1_071700 [Acanthamoeba castellanii str. Neff]ELR23548.1 hypothetical protein ACA1_071700 [Acanthamoeba castellanii str. Neff]
MDGRMAEGEEGEEFDEFEDEDSENEDYGSDEYEESEEHQYNVFTYPMSEEAQQNPPAGIDEQQSPEVLSLSQMRKSTSAAGRRSLRSSRASSRSRIARFGRWTANAWNDTKSLFLGPLFIGIALGVGISLGRSTFLVAMQRTTSLLLGRSGSARFGIAS